MNTYAEDFSDPLGAGHRFSLRTPIQNISLIHWELDFAFNYEGFLYSVCSTFLSTVVLQSVEQRDLEEVVIVTEMDWITWEIGDIHIQKGELKYIQ